MWNSFSRSRKAQTTLPCRECGKPVIIERSCHEAHLTCPACGKSYPIQEYIREADEAMEDFLNHVYCDRM